MLGLAAGIGSLYLFGTPQGKRFTSKLAATLKLIREEVDDVRATPRSSAYQDLSLLLDQLKQPQLVPTPASSFTSRLKSTLFASPANSSPVPKTKPAPKRYFKVK